MGDINKNKKFTYKTTVTWNEEKKVFLSSFGKQTIEISAPAEFKGRAGVWTPEDLFIASVNACIKTTFLHYAQREHFDFLTYESEAEGILEKVENKIMFSEIKVMPKITVASDNQIEKAKDLMGLAEKNCFISNSIAAKVIVYPEIKAKS